MHDDITDRIDRIVAITNKRKPQREHLSRAKYAEVNLLPAIERDEAKLK